MTGIVSGEVAMVVPPFWCAYFACLLPVLPTVGTS